MSDDGDSNRTRRDTESALLRTALQQQGQVIGAILQSVHRLEESLGNVERKIDMLADALLEPDTHSNGHTDVDVGEDADTMPMAK